MYPQREPDRATLGVLATGHFVVDMSVGAIPAFLPGFAAALTLSDTQAAMVLGASTVASSAIQPAFGAISDRWATPVFLWGGVAIAAAGFAISGFAQSYGLLLLAILVSGIGVAAYHPEAARIANLVAGHRTATGVAWFSVGGNLGFACGPLLAAATIPIAGMDATAFVVAPGLVAIAIIVMSRARLDVRLSPIAPERTRRAHVGGTSLLVGIVTLRTWAQFGFLAIAPLLLSKERAYSDRATALCVFAFTMAGALGTLVGAAVADRVGARRMLTWTLPVATPCLTGFVLTDGLTSIALLASGGFALLASFSVTVVLGQAYLPGRLALAAGLMIGVAAIGSAVLGLAWLSPLSDAAGRDTALLAASALPLVGAALCRFLPEPPRPDAALDGQYGSTG